jgi:O-succinylbenzoate synthase
MSDSLKQHWREELELFYVPQDTSVEWVEFDFAAGYKDYNRDGLIFTGPYGASEASPLQGYFDSKYHCIKGALDSISFEWPKALRSKEEIKVNLLVANDQDINKPELIGTDCVKVKVHSFDDVERVKKVRDICGKDTRIRIDCNGVFDVDSALKIIQNLREIDLEFVEQPCKSNEENAQIRKQSNVLIALDESANSREDIDEIQSLDAADIIVVKVQTAGGIFSALDNIDLWGKDFVISSAMESEVGINLAFVLARAVDNLKYACGLAPSPIHNIIREPLYG